VEPNETFLVNLSGAAGATIADAQATGTITQRRRGAFATLSIGDVTLAEGNAGTGQRRVQRDALGGPVPRRFTVGFATANGTATAAGPTSRRRWARCPRGSDYQASTGTVTFAAGQTTQTVTVPVIGDTRWSRTKRSWSI